MITTSGQDEFRSLGFRVNKHEHALLVLASIQERIPLATYIRKVSLKSAEKELRERGIDPRGVPELAEPRRVPFARDRPRKGISQKVKRPAA